MTKLEAITQAMSILRQAGYRSFQDPIMDALLEERIRVNPSYQGVSVSIREITSGNIAESFKEEEIKQNEADYWDGDDSHQE